MFRALVTCGLCAAAALSPAFAETFVIEPDTGGHEATIKIPAGALTKLSAERAESLEGYAGSQIEVMRLSGAVVIGLAGSAQAIEIKADKVVLEVTADTMPGPAKRSRADAATNKVLRSTSSSVSSGDDSQLFVGNVIFDLQTASGPVEIKADRVEHQLSSEDGA